MKKRLLLTFSVASLMLVACNGGSSNGIAAKKELTTEKDKFSYALGADYGKYLVQFKDEFDANVVMQAINDAVEGKEPLLNPEEAKAAQDVVFKRISEQKQEEAKKTAVEKKVAGEKFLAENAKKEGIKVTASGLQYEVITEGNGAKPAETDKVTVNYLGKKLDDTEFDSSYKRGKPATFELNRVIPGWTEGIQLMSIGSKYRFFMKPELAYGEMGTRGGPIGPNETLVFEVELLSIGDAPVAKEAPKAKAAPKAETAK